jgi:hypothetical protein
MSKAIYVQHKKNGYGRDLSTMSTHLANMRAAKAVYVKRDLHKVKETCKRDLCTAQENGYGRDLLTMSTHLAFLRAAKAEYVKRDLHKVKETCKRDQ